jgi:hypothetical protein
MEIPDRKRLISEPKRWANNIKVDPMERDCESKNKSVLA